MNETLPEIARLTQLLEEIERAPDSLGKRNAGRVVADLYAGIAGAGSSFESISSLFEAIRSLPSLIVEQFPEQGRRAAALGNVDRLKELVSPEALAVPFETFRSNTEVSRGFLSSTMVLLGDIQFGASLLQAKATDIVDEIEKLKSKLHENDGLSHASKVVIDAQLTLIERSLVRFSDSGVGPFRESVFSSIGRIVVELKSNSDNQNVAVGETLDDVLRVYGLMEAGGTLLTLGAPVAMKLIGVG